MNKGLTTNFLLFLPIKIIFLNLFYLHVMDFAYGYDLILLQESNNIDEYEVRFIQSSGNLLNPQSQSGSLEQQQQQQQQQHSNNNSSSNNSNNNNYHRVMCNHHNSTSRINNNYHRVTYWEHHNNHRRLRVSHYHLCLKNYNDCLWIYHHNFQMIYFELIHAF